MRRQTKDRPAQPRRKQHHAHAVFDVGAYPRASLVLGDLGAAFPVPTNVVAKVDGLHRAVTVVASVRLGVAVVEATPVVVVPPTKHGVHRLRLVSNSRAVCRSRQCAVSVARLKVRRVHRVAANHVLVPGGVDPFVQPLPCRRRVVKDRQVV